ncbi:19308_t:CDS:1, partial [Funneliformis geosporum]
ELALSFALIASIGVVPLPSDNVEASVKFRPDCEYRCRPQPHYCESCKPTR